MRPGKKNPQAIDPRALLAGRNEAGGRRRTAALHKKVGCNASRAKKEGTRNRRAKRAELGSGLPFFQRDIK
jgi:hypothetical protein